MCTVYVFYYSTKLDVVPDIPGLWEEQADDPVDTSFTKMSKMEKVNTAKYVTIYTCT